MSDGGNGETWVLPAGSEGDQARIAAAVSQGDRAAEHAFVERYQPKLRALLLARTRNADVASDLLQDVLIEALCALRRGQLREPSKLTAFVLGIARNLLNSHFRSAAREPDSLELPDDLPDLGAAAARLEDEERESAALRAIASLETVDRTILQMTLIDGLKPGVIAQKLMLKPELVRQRKLRATRRIIDFVRARSQSSHEIHLVTRQKE
ncbi:MAG TPA: sigma-70 family RNA polymerase sigma factor [Terracidiphilus sp.]|nr:sigma-70 family RNA polymerase sigma factor [Terracidiphilus sp.]